VASWTQKQNKKVEN